MGEWKENSIYSYPELVEVRFTLQPLCPLDKKPCKHQGKSGWVEEVGNRTPVKWLVTRDFTEQQQGLPVILQSVLN
jgi:hypothetical protein